MLLVADNLQITHPVISDALRRRDPGPVRDMVARCVAAGADAIDINPGPLSKNPEAAMAFFVETARTVTDKPLLLDTTNPAAMEAGLKADAGLRIINGFSLEPAKREQILPLAASYRVDIIGFLLHPDGRVPSDAAERMTIAVALYDACRGAGVPRQRLIVDPVIAPVMWANGAKQGREILSVLRHLPDLLGYPVRTIAGISNLTTGSGPLEEKLLLERTYLPMLAAAGLTMALMNVFHAESVRVARACEAFSRESIFTWAALGRKQRPDLTS